VKTRKKAEIRRRKSESRLAVLARQCGERANGSAPPKSQGCATGPNSEFGIRISGAILVLVTSVRLAAADTNAPDALTSSLRPPRGEFLPTFWEQYGAWVILLAVFLMAAFAIIVWLATRPKPLAPVPWAVQARRQLEPFHSQPENGSVLSQISQILRHHLASAFGFPSGETTTSEFCHALSGSERVGPDLSRETSDFLEDCDLRKFAPGPPPLAPCNAVARSLRIIEKAEKRLADFQCAEAASAGDSDSSRSSKADQEQGLASGA
jgi:hypothetical protein